uniref:Uncharacterized protein n=1 Tax=Arundo donax TaxID=35708 RepID=A0A0A9GZ36_ARUDO
MNSDKLLRMMWKCALRRKEKNLRLELSLVLGRQRRTACAFCVPICRSRLH